MKSNRLVIAGVACAIGVVAAPAAAGTCRGGERFCSDSITVDIWKLGWHVRAGDGAVRPLRFVCDINGVNCHYSHSYLLDDDGNYRYDPAIGGDDTPQKP